jgi:adenine deaminase
MKARCVFQRVRTRGYPHGVTSAITDPREIANVLGLEGTVFHAGSAKNIPFSMYVMASRQVPATSMETNGAQLEAHDIKHCNPTRGY